MKIDPEPTHPQRNFGIVWKILKDLKEPIITLCCLLLLIASAMYSHYTYSTVLLEACQTTGLTLFCIAVAILAAAVIFAYANKYREAVPVLGLNIIFVLCSIGITVLAHSLFNVSSIGLHQRLHGVVIEKWTLFDPFSVTEGSFETVHGNQTHTVTTRATTTDGVRVEASLTASLALNEDPQTWPWQRTPHKTEDGRSTKASKRTQERLVTALAKTLSERSSEQLLENHLKTSSIAINHISPSEIGLKITGPVEVHTIHAVP